jgi:hypothetical protein
MCGFGQIKSHSLGHKKMILNKKQLHGMTYVIYEYDFGLSSPHARFSVSMVRLGRLNSCIDLCCNAISH